MNNFLKKRLSLFLKKRKDIYLVESDTSMQFILDSLEDEEILGVDTEFDWRTTYYPKLCLLQIATEKKILLIDCINCKNLSYLKKIFENPKKLLIFHSSRSDTTVLNSSLGIKVKNVFDIQKAEQLISGGDIKNYGSIVQKYFYTSLSKSETNSNWLKRPFTSNQLDYAADDVDFLLGIYFKQIKILKRKNLLKKAFKLSRIESEFGNQELHISRVKKLKNPSILLKNIFLWREKVASEKNIPPSFIFKNKFIKNIAKDIASNSFISSELMHMFKDEDLLERFIKEIK